MPLSQPGRETRLYYNIKDFGATGDGVTDDYASVAAAVAAAAAADGAVFVPAGTYVLGSRLTLTEGVSVYGDGEASWLDGPITIGGDQLIENLRIGASGYSVQHVDGATDVLLRRVRITGGAASVAVVRLGQTDAEISCENLSFVDCAIGHVLRVAIPVRNTAGDTVSIGWSNTFGLPVPITANGDVYLAARKASAATAFTTEAPLYPSANWGTVDVGSLTAGDTVMWWYWGAQ